MASCCGLRGFRSKCRAQAPKPKPKTPAVLSVAYVDRALECSRHLAVGVWASEMNNLIIRPGIDPNVSTVAGRCQLLLPKRLDT